MGVLNLALGCRSTEYSVQRLPGGQLSFVQSAQSHLCAPPYVVLPPAPTMETCLCSTIRRLARDYDERGAQQLGPALNSHLRDLRSILARSKSLSREARYHITPINHRTAKIFLLDSVDLRQANQVCETFRGDVDAFWTPFDDVLHAELRRRLACVVIFLRSKLDAEASVPPAIARLFHGQKDYSDIRHSGRKYIKIARRLGGIGTLFWLPLTIPSST